MNDNLNMLIEHANLIYNKLSLKHVASQFDNERIRYINQTINIMAKAIEDAIKEREHDIDNDKFDFVIENMQYISSIIATAELNSDMQCFIDNINLLAYNFIGALEGFEDKKQELERVVYSIKKQLELISTVDILIRRTNDLIKRISEVENMNRLAPRLSRHLIMELKNNED